MEAVKKAVMEGEASIHTASEMVDLLSKEKQEELLNGTEEKVTLEMVRKKAGKLIKKDGLHRSDSRKTRKRF